MPVSGGGLEGGPDLAAGAAGGATELVAAGQGRVAVRSTSARSRGFSIQLQNADDRSYEKLITEIAATGANAVCLIVAAFQENCDSTSIFVEARRTPSPERLKQVIAHAHKEHLRVLLMPIVLLENPRAGEWRGKINPRSWDDWWEDYDSYILHFAAIAQAADVDVFMVGSELVSTEKDHGDRWRDLVRQVRKKFKGLLSYSANWDHYRPVSWWKDLDIIGMTTYYDLTDGKEPTIPRLMESWRPIRKDDPRLAGHHRPAHPVHGGRLAQPDHLRPVPVGLHAQPGQARPQGPGQLLRGVLPHVGGREVRRGLPRLGVAKPSLPDHRPDGHRLHPVRQAGHEGHREVLPGPRSQRRPAPRGDPAGDPSRHAPRHRPIRSRSSPVRRADDPDQTRDNQLIPR